MMFDSLLHGGRAPRVRCRALTCFFLRFFGVKPRVKRTILLPPGISSAGRVGCLNFDMVGGRLPRYSQGAVVELHKRFYGLKSPEARRPRTGTDHRWWPSIQTAGKRPI